MSTTPRPPNPRLSTLSEVLLLLLILVNARPAVHWPVTKELLRLIHRHSLACGALSDRFVFSSSSYSPKQKPNNIYNHLMFGLVSSSSSLSLSPSLSLSLSDQSLHLSMQCHFCCAQIHTECVGGGRTSTETEMESQMKINAPPGRTGGGPKGGSDRK